MNLRENVLKAPNYLSAVITFFFFSTEKRYRGNDLAVLNGSYGPASIHRVGVRALLRISQENLMFLGAFCQ